MEIIKHFLILKFHLSLKDSDYYNTSSTGKCDSNECCINYINIISDRSDLIFLLLQVDNLYFLCYKMSFQQIQPLTPPPPEPPARTIPSPKCHGTFIEKTIRLYNILNKCHICNSFVGIVVN